MAHPDAVKLQLLNLSYDGVTGHTEFDEHGDVTRYPSCSCSTEASRSSTTSSSSKAAYSIFRRSSRTGLPSRGT